MKNKKIAFVSGWYLQQGSTYLHPDHRYIFDCLYKTAKRNFLPNQEVDFLFITNGDIQLEGVKSINIDYFVPGFWHACLMKLLCLNYIQNDYDYIFVSDYDQIFIKEVQEAILDTDIVMLEHFYGPPLRDIHVEVTDAVELNFDTTKETWTMGNFFGGKGNVMKSLGKQAEQWHQFYKKENYNNDIHFYSRYPEELFLLKYVFENNINHKRLPTTMNPDQSSKDEIFLGDFKEQWNIYDGDLFVNVLHNTKKNIDQLKKIINKFV